MLGFVVRRVVTSILLLVATSALVFFVLRLLPGDPVITSLGASPGVSKATIARLRHEAGLDRPIITQYLSWLWAALHGDLGKSYFSQFPVSSLIRTRLPPTLELTFLGVLLSVIFAFPGALWAARHPRGAVDAGFDAFWTVSLSLPAFIVGIFLTYFLSVRAGILPARGYVAFRRRPRRQPPPLRASGPDPGARRSAAALPVPAGLAARADERGVRPDGPREGTDRATRGAEARPPELARSRA